MAISRRMCASRLSARVSGLISRQKRRRFSCTHKHRLDVFVHETQRAVSDGKNAGARVGVCVIRRKQCIGYPPVAAFEQA